MVYWVWVDGEEVFERTLTPEAAREGWWPAKVDLGPWAGREVRLTLETDPGPAGDGQGDWAGWGEVRLVDVAQAALATVDLDIRVIGAWSAGGVTEQEFLVEGKKAFSARRYQEALWWFGRAVEMKPSSAGPWYYVGRAYEGLKKPSLALAAFRRAEQQPDSWRIVSSLYFHIGWLSQTSSAKSLPLDKALELYDAALAADRFVGHWERIGTHYNRGDVLRRMGRLQEAIEEFRWVVKERPEHYWGNIWLGVVLWQANGDVAGAEEYLRRAIALKPQTKWAYRWLGKIYWETGRLEEATPIYRRVLEIDPQDQVALRFLRSRRNRVVSLDFDQLNTTFEGAPPEAILEWAVETFWPKIAMSSSFQMQSLPLLHMVSRIVPQLPIIFLDTGFHFAETLSFRDRLVQEWGA
ncbi:MAG: tetratricopeptide repeat protein [Ardenticatenia bacterium]|nr:tetratricopeptide repeat protein [Ardenticatenia bacterium]